MAAILVSALVGTIAGASSAPVAAVGGPIPAFPGAEGFGAYSVGGRGGQVIEVTNLDDNGPGSFRAAVEAAGPRIVVFRVGGTIKLTSSLTIVNPYLTIAGQTAPGDGIAVTYPGELTFSGTHNIVVRYIRFRPTASVDNVDVINLTNGTYNVIFDHVSASWGTDETVSIVDQSHDVTIQWSIVSEGIRDRPAGFTGAGSLINGGARNVSLHHNVYAHLNHRNAKMMGEALYLNGQDALFDFVNNVVYNWGRLATQVAGSAKANVVANYYEPGPDSAWPELREITIEQAESGRRMFAAGNVGPSCPAGCENDWVGGMVGGSDGTIKTTSEKTYVTTQFVVPDVTTFAAPEAFDLVLATAGASYPLRDDVDSRLVSDVLNGTGTIFITDPLEVGGWPVLSSGTAPVDTDSDGMPDAWEITQSLNPNDPADGNADADADGYTNVEEYLDFLAPADGVGGTPISFTPPNADVFATVETEPVPNAGDAADDAAIWLHPSDTSLSTVIGTDKQGGIGVYALDGSLIEYRPDGSMNNVDLRYNFPLGGQSVALVAASNRTDLSIGLYSVDETTRTLTNVAARSITVGLTDAYGLCMYRSPITEAYYAFVTGQVGDVEQWHLFDDGAGKVDATMVRQFAVGSRSEGCVVDDELGNLYIGEEGVGLWKYGAEPDSGISRTLIDAAAPSGRFTGEVEGLALYLAANNAGYLIASNQKLPGVAGDDFLVYDRAGDNVFLGSFSVIDDVSPGVDGVSTTDGIDVTNLSLGAGFPQGVFVAQDDVNTNPAANQNFKLVAWESIAGGLTLTSDSSFDPRVPLVPPPVPSVAAESIVARWAFDEGSGITAADSSGNGMDGTLVNSPEWVGGVFGNALLFDVAQQQSVFIGDYPQINFGAGSFSIAAWVKYDTCVDCDVLRKGSTNTAPDWYKIEVPYADQKLSFNLNTDQVTTTEIISPLTYNDGFWHHVVGVRDTEGGQVRLYVDGLEVVSTPNPPGSVSNTADLTIGSKDTMDDDFFNGAIDDVTFFDRTLTPVEVSQLYNAGLDTTGPSDPQSLTASAVSSRQIDLAWAPATDAESGISSYRVFRGGMLVGTPDNTSYSDVGLAESTTYSYTVSAVNGAGMESTEILPVAATTLVDTEAPTIASVASRGDATTVRVTFSEPVDEASATDLTNYVLDPSVTIVGATLEQDLETVTLGTSPLTSVVLYKLTVNGVKDRASTPNTIAVDSVATFSYLPRVTGGLILFYDFSEGSGDVVYDWSGFGDPLNLQILDTSEVQWLADSNGVNLVSGASALKSSGPATKLQTALAATGQASLEAWVTPASLTQGGPARIVTASVGTSNSQMNIHLGQNGDEGSFRLRTENNLSSWLRAAGVFSDTEQPVHLVTTYDGTTQRLYANGVLAPQTLALTGGFANWDPSFPLVIGNEATMDRSWLGKIYLVAAYDKALTDAEVLLNFDAGFAGSTSVTLGAADVQVRPGDVATVPIVLNEVPTGLSGLDISINLLDSTVAQITDVRAADFGLIVAQVISGSEAYIAAADLNGLVPAGDTDVVVGTLTIQTLIEGTTDIVVTGFLDDQSGNPLDVTFLPGVLSVGNALPAVNLVSSTTISEGDTYAASGSFSDPDDTSWTATVDYGDGSGVQFLALTGTSFDLNHTYQDDGTFTARVTITDAIGGVGEKTVTVTVLNVAPIVSAGSGVVIDAGDNFATSGSFTDPGADVWSATVDYGDGSGPESLLLLGTTFDLSHVYGLEGTYTIVVTLSDEDGGSTTATIDVTVLYPYPTLSGMTSPARDLDGDKRAEDLNGNFRLDFADVVSLFEFLNTPEVQDNSEDFDFNGNGLVDMDDVVTLFNQLVGG